MYLFIFESIGTSELIMIGIVALIFLGPRRLPEMAKKMGKMMADFRSTTNEFKQTWEREVNFEEEAKALRIDEIESEPVARITKVIDEPVVGEIDADEFQRRLSEPPPVEEKAEETEVKASPKTGDANDKRNWL